MFYTKNTLDGDFLGQQLDYLVDAIYNYERKTRFTLAVELIAAEINLHVESSCPSSPARIADCEGEVERLKAAYKKYIISGDDLRLLGDIEY